MTGYKRGDVVLAIFPNSDRQTFKKRPVMVVQNESVRTHFGQTIVAPITSNRGRVSPAMLPVNHLAGVHSGCDGRLRGRDGAPNPALGTFGVAGSPGLIAGRVVACSESR